MFVYKRESCRYKTYNNPPLPQMKGSRPCPSDPPLKPIRSVHCCLRLYLGPAATERRTTTPNQKAWTAAIDAPGSPRPPRFRSLVPSLSSEMQAVPVTGVDIRNKGKIEGVGLLGTSFGHASDGEFHAGRSSSSGPYRQLEGKFHLQLLFPSDVDVVEAKEPVEGMVNRVIVPGGTWTGRHGTGIGKREHLHKD